MVDCSHVFRDSNKCVKCGTGVARLLLNERAEWALVTRQLRADLARVNEQLVESQRNGAIVNIELTKSRAETARLREALEKYTNCWHCGDALLEEEPYHCEACPAWDCCDEGDCDEPGCIERTSDPEPTT